MIEKVLSFLNSNLDKVVHFLSGYLTATILPIQPEHGLFLAFVSGIGKELYDRNQPNHTSETLDAVATITGGCLGYVALLLK